MVQALYAAKIKQRFFKILLNLEARVFIYE
jgi:hypothetical protein